MPYRDRKLNEAIFCMRYRDYTTYTTTTYRRFSVHLCSHHIVGPRAFLAFEVNNSRRLHGSVRWVSALQVHSPRDHAYMVPEIAAHLTRFMNILVRYVIFFIKSAQFSP